ncbi:hypothetical protein FGB62_182g05 [Gracilaria domingensis]|nr:hypothetical protein FGB62_182g05 [Gracilaria domingensis]
MIDSGTGAHMTCDSSSLTRTQHCIVPIALGDNSLLNAHIKGTKRVQWQANNLTTEIHLTYTLCSSNLAMELLSVPALADKNMVVVFTKTHAVILDAQNEFVPIGIGSRDTDDLYYVGKPAFATNVSLDKAMMAAVLQQTSDESEGDASDDDTMTYAEDGSNEDTQTDEDEEEVDLGKLNIVDIGDQGTGNEVESRWH